MSRRKRNPVAGCRLKLTRCGRVTGRCPLKELRLLMLKALASVKKARSLEGPAEVTAPLHSADYTLELALQSEQDCCRPEPKGPHSRE